MVMVDLRLFVCPVLRLPWILLFPVCTSAPCVQHDSVFPWGSVLIPSRAYVFPLGFPFDAVAVAALAAGSNVSSGTATERMEPKL